MHVLANVPMPHPFPLVFGPISIHGTTMASCAAGSFAGPSKRARLGLVQLQTNRPSFAPISSTLLAFDEVLRHSQRVGSGGLSVLGMSFGAPVSLLWWPNPTRNTGDNGLANGQDVFGLKLQDLYQVGIAVVTSAGNSALLHAQPGQKDISFYTPARLGGADTPLIVVGNSEFNDARYRTSTFNDGSGKSILSLYAQGTNCVCGAWDIGAANLASAQNKFKLLTDTPNTADENGSSQAAAQTVGVIANMITNPDLHRRLIQGGLSSFAMAVKNELLQMSDTYKGAFPDSKPRLSNGMGIPCGPAIHQGSPPLPPENIPNLWQVDLTAQITNIATGMQVTDPNPVSLAHSSACALCPFVWPCFEYSWAAEPHPRPYTDGIQPACYNT